MHKLYFDPEKIHFYIYPFFTCDLFKLIAQFEKIDVTMLVVKKKGWKIGTGFGEYEKKIKKFNNPIFNPFIETVTPLFLVEFLNKNKFEIYEYGLTVSNSFKIKSSWLLNDAKVEFLESDFKEIEKIYDLIKIPKLTLDKLVDNPNRMITINEKNIITYKSKEIKSFDGYMDDVYMYWCAYLSGHQKVKFKNWFRYDD